jgi:uncharacterized membrane protein YkoI
MNAPSFCTSTFCTSTSCTSKKNKSSKISKWLLWLALVLPAHVLSAPADFFEKSELHTQFAAPAAISLEQAADKVRRETGGRVLSASPTEKGGKRGYDVRVLLDGKRVKKVFVDAHSGS